MNWGYKITVVIILFIIVMVGMVAVAFRQTNEMIDSDYYNKEIKYQSLIDAAKNLNEISSEKILHTNDSELVVQIPTAVTKEFSDGKIELIKSSKEKDDRTFLFNVDSTGKYMVKLSKIPSGFYLARIFWKSIDKSYYREQQISIYQK